MRTFRRRGARRSQAELRRNMRNGSRCTEIEYNSSKFLITHRPTDLTMASYIAELDRYNVTAVVRVCSSSYNKNRLEENGIAVYDLEYPDGTFPSREVIKKWFKIIRGQFEEDGCVAIHCVAGLGRAPVMVALTLVDLGMDHMDAVELIRRKRPGSFNARQLDGVLRYHPRRTGKDRSKYRRFLCFIL